MAAMHEGGMYMITSSIRNIDLFKIVDDNTNAVYYGGNQEWYKKRWQRLSGCGPSTAANIIHYLHPSDRDNRQTPSCMRKGCYLSLMEEVWEYVTPSYSGISSTGMLIRGVLSYAKAKNMNLQPDFIDIPKNQLLRPAFSEILAFLEEVLRNDTPAAFLNLHNGNIADLESWHWVTIISLEYAKDGSAAFVDVLDQSIIKKIDLAEWYRTTILGGGFVSFSKK